MSAADEAYERLMAERRYIPPEEQAQVERDRERQLLNARIRRKLPPIY